MRRKSCVGKGAAYDGFAEIGLVNRKARAGRPLNDSPVRSFFCRFVVIYPQEIKKIEPGIGYGRAWGCVVMVLNVQAGLLPTVAQL
jgi:hypothetical protein